MAQRVYFVGDANGGWNQQDFWPDGLSLDSVVFEEDKPVRAGELTLIGQQAFIRLRDHLRQIVSSGFYRRGPVTGSQTVQNTLVVGESWLNVAGQVVHVGNPDGAANAASLAMPPPPSSGTRTDLVYIGVWVQEVGASGSTDAGGTTITDRNLYKWGGVGNGTYTNDWYWNDPIEPNEPTRRFQVRWRLVVQQNSSATSPDGFAAQAGASSPTAYTFSSYETALRTQLDGSQLSVEMLARAGDGTLTAGQALHCVDGYAYAVPLVSVIRRAGQPFVLTADVTDLRPPAQTQPGIVVDISNIYPTVLNQTSVLDHLVAEQFVYTGTAAWTGTGRATIAQFNLGQAALATRFTLNKATLPLGSAEGVGSTFGPVRRVSLNLQKLGAGAAITVDLCTDGVTVPGGVLASRTLPASWLTATARDVSFYLNTAALADATSYWLVVHKTASTTDTALLAAAGTTDPAQLTLSAADGSSWGAASAVAPLGFTVYTGTAGDLVHALIDGNDLYLYEYDASANLVNIGESFVPGASDQARNSYLTVQYDANGNVVSMA